MTYPFMPDPLPPGTGESEREEWRPRTYEIVCVLGDGVARVERRFSDLTKALDYADALRAELRGQHYTEFFVGVQDENDPESGWLDAVDDL